MIISRDNNLFHFKLSLIYWVQNQLKYPNNSLIKSPETLKRHSLNKLGGEAAVTAVTPQFYANIQADATVSNFFNGINMADQKNKQASFYALLLENQRLWEAET
ncbi:unnamed protein product (macronuclear) [Paramecium tetraurelia]|uniref:Uncharacterized protein n=1 Tax=Paramecium tetraurelia TaxID=5888 RepID=A0DEL4_PARTE|nr:uncharacterized protein GSPATT00016307001 [Paramecium tetraurelia]CAK81481.1 unnamed protein product [Paramecium tetraurelia]|eukprot:XP_001448878.1 hypothetical protein (macronuclear) [Paramecium tetraurelia strain d4-2]